MFINTQSSTFGKFFTKVRFCRHSFFLQVRFIDSKIALFVRKNVAVNLISLFIRKQFKNWRIFGILGRSSYIYIYIKNFYMVDNCGGIISWNVLYRESNDYGKQKSIYRSTIKPNINSENYRQKLYFVSILLLTKYNS